MKKIILSVLLAIIFTFIVAFGTACKNEAAIGEPVADTTEKGNVSDDEEEQNKTAQSQETVEDKSEEVPSEKEIAQDTEMKEQKMVEWSIDSNMGELLDNPETRAILEKYIPEIVSSDRLTNQDLIL